MHVSNWLPHWLSHRSLELELDRELFCTHTSVDHGLLRR